MPDPRSYSRPWRLLDTGLRSGAENMSLDSALLTARAEGSSPDTLRFLRFSPPVALVGYHQAVAEEIRVDYCREAGIDINRRITGGGAIYFDAGQLGWEIICSYQALGQGRNMERITRTLCGAAAQGLRGLGMDALFRPRNDIEVQGRKISGTGGSFDGECFLFQGTLLIDFNLQNLIKALRIPTEKLNRRELSSAAERVTSVKEQLGFVPPLGEIQAALVDAFRETFGITFETCGLTSREEELFTDELAVMRSDSWIYGDRLPSVHQEVLRSIHKEDGGLIRVAAKVDVGRRILRDILITGDFFVRPRRALYDLEAALRHKKLGDLDETVHRFFADSSRGLLQLTADDFVRAIRMAVDKVGYTTYGFSMEEANSLTCLHGSMEDILGRCDLLLLPYCAKLPECPLRFSDGCEQCGKCTVGEAWAMGTEAGLRVTTIQNYEHLVEELIREKDSGTRGYIGCCCEAFMVKRQEAFKKAGLPGLLVDIENTTCYELRREQEAYLGTFTSQTHLRLDLLRKILDAVAGARAAGSRSHAAA
jgi:lipoate-protein ligase A